MNYFSWYPDKFSVFTSSNMLKWNEVHLCQYHNVSNAVAKPKIMGNLSVTTTSPIKFITCELLSNVFNEDWRYQFNPANNFSFRRQRSIPLDGRYIQVSLYIQL